MTKKLSPGMEVDAWCTKCKLDLGHRIVAMLGDQPKRVECRTCGSHHNYYRPKTLPGLTKPKPARAAAAASARSSGSTASARAVEQARIENERERAWEKMVSGRSVGDFKPYRVSLQLAEGDLIHHAKFGDGYVVKVLDKNKVEIMFKDGARTLAQGMGA